MTTRILLADDHPLFRDGLRGLLADTDGFDLIGEAGDGDEAIALASSLHPDVVLMDLRMPGTGGVEATRRIVASGVAGAVLVLTMSDDDGSVFAAIRAGAKGYILKGAPGPEIAESIRVVASGRAILDSSIAARMSRYFARPHSGSRYPDFPQLSARESEVLALLAQGLSNAEIASSLVLSEKTVRNNVSVVLAKLNAPTRAAAIALARDSPQTPP